MKCVSIQNQKKIKNLGPEFENYVFLENFVSEDGKNIFKNTYLMKNLALQEINTQ